jgi:hypothetical protein
MGDEMHDFKQRLDRIRVDACEFLDDLQCRPDIPGRWSLWFWIQEQDRVWADDMRHCLRLFTLDLALAMEKSPIVTRIDLRDVGRTGKRMCAALRLREYTGSVTNPGEPIGLIDAKLILEAGFDAMAEWVDLVRPSESSHPELV